MLRNNWLLLAALAAVGCSSSTPANTNPNGNQNNQGDDDAATAGDDSGIGTPVTTGDSGTPSTGTDSGTPTTGVDSSVPTATAVPLPFYVSDQFVPTGFMGDSTASMTAITLSHDATMCKSPRTPGAGGDCFTATWAPSLADAGAAWAGVYWQSSANNWGSKPGKLIAPGAKEVSFWAAGAAGGEVIQLCAGGINASGATPALPYSDTFTVKQPAVTLTTSWQQFSFSLEGTAYTTVLGGFCWVASTTATESITFYIDDIQWQ